MIWISDFNVTEENTFGFETKTPWCGEYSANPKLRNRHNIHTYRIQANMSYIPLNYVPMITNRKTMIIKIPRRPVCDPVIKKVSTPISKPNLVTPKPVLSGRLAEVSQRIGFKMPSKSELKRENFRRHAAWLKARGVGSERTYTERPRLFSCERLDRFRTRIVWSTGRTEIAHNSPSFFEEADDVPFFGGVRLLQSIVGYSLC